MARGSIRRRFFMACVTTGIVTLVVYATAAIAYVHLDDIDMKMDDGDSFREEAVELITGSLVVAPIVILAAFVTATLLARRAAKPIEDAIQAARETTAHDLRRTLPVPERGGELGELVVSLNELFVRLDEGFGALASFAADASHELRTPLTVMAAETQVALRHRRSIEEWEATARSNLDDLQRMSALVDGLLVFARAGADSPATRTDVDIIECVDSVTAQLSSAAADRGIALAGPNGDVSGHVTANPVLIEAAVRNLVSNALAAAKPGGHVEVSIERGAATVRILVDDDGPGLGPTPETLFVPFRRGAQASADTIVRGAGVGLGLAIARRIADSHDGSLLPGVSPLGGARLVLTLPVRSGGVRDRMFQDRRIPADRATTY
jgi:two-component system, OmpR family, sensor kinase